MSIKILTFANGTKWVSAQRVIRKRPLAPVIFVIDPSSLKSCEPESSWASARKKMLSIIDAEDGAIPAEYPF